MNILPKKHSLKEQIEMFEGKATTPPNVGTKAPWGVGLLLPALQSSLCSSLRSGIPAPIPNLPSPGQNPSPGEIQFNFIFF